MHIPIITVFNICCDLCKICRFTFFLELQEKGESADLAKIAADIEDRDYRDMHRDISPLRQAEDATLVDSSDMTIDQVVERILELCR